MNLKKENNKIKQELGDWKALMQSPSDVKGVKQADNLADIPIQTKGQYVTNNATDLSTLPQVIRARTRKLSVHFNCFFSLTSSGFN